MSYRLTFKGKMAWGLMTLCFFIGMIGSLTYIVSYFKPVDEPIVIVSPKEETNQETEEEATESFEDEPITIEDSEDEPTTPEDSGVYTPYDLEFLKAFHMVMTFEKDQTKPDKQMMKALEAYKHLFEAHRMESIVIEGYFVNGTNAETVSETRLKTLELFFKTLGIDSDKINVYNLMGELKPEERIEIYYKDHFQKAPVK